MIIGIDFSIKSTAITIIEESTGSEKMLSFPRQGALKDSFVKNLENAGVKVCTVPDEPRLAKKASLTDRERSSMKDARSLISSIETEIRIAISNNPEVVYVGIEGFSFGSSGNRLSQISGYQWLLRNSLWTSLGIPVDQIWFFSPMTVKATAGKGNYSKEEMIQAFIGSNSTSEMKKHLLENSSDFQNKKGAWNKPCDDIVDSYWVAKTVQKTLLIS
jgi:hypothetical protein